MIVKALLGCIVAVIAFNIFYNGPFMLQLMEYAVQPTIEYLNDFHFYISQKRMEMVHAKLKEENRRRKVYSPRSESDVPCTQHSYRSRIIHRKPLIIYIENFITKNEINHILELTEPNFKPSMVFSGEDGSNFVSEYRTSTSAYIHRHQTYIVKCLEQRFAQFQGGIDVQNMEPFQVVKYIDNQQSGTHFDWFDGSELSKNGAQRVTTFFSYLQSNCSMGETEFFSIPFNRSLHQQFCDILVCDKKSSQRGLRFRPLSGNTLFWYNINEHGDGDVLTDHAGLPPGPNSFKIGLNTWTRTEKFYWPGDT